MTWLEPVVLEGQHVRLEPRPVPNTSTGCGPPAPTRASGDTSRFEGILRKHMLVADGTWRDSVYFSILDTEWPDVAAALRQRIATHAGSADR